MREVRRRRCDDGFRREALELIKAGAGKDTYDNDTYDNDTEFAPARPVA